MERHQAQDESTDRAQPTLQRKESPNGHGPQPQWAFCGECGAEFVEVEYVPASQLEAAVEALRILDAEAIRDPTPYSSAWLVPAGAMDLARSVLQRARGGAEPSSVSSDEEHRGR